MSTLKANKDKARFISNPISQDVADGDWVDHEVVTKYKLPEIVVDGTSTSTSLVTGTTVAENDKVRLYDGSSVVEDSLGTTTATPYPIDASSDSTYRLDGVLTDIKAFGSDLVAVETNVSNNGVSVTTPNFTTSNINGYIFTVFDGQNVGGSKPKGLSIPTIMDFTSTSTQSIMGYIYVGASGNAGIMSKGNAGNPAQIQFSIGTNYFYSNYTNVKQTQDSFSEGWHPFAVVCNAGSFSLYMDNRIIYSGATSLAYNSYGGGFGYYGVNGGSGGMILANIKIYKTVAISLETFIQESTLLKYQADITSFGLTTPPTKAYFNKTIDTTLSAEDTSKCKSSTVTQIGVL